MKIGYVLDDTLDTPDGVQQYVLTLGAWMSSQGHDVHYLVGQTTRTDIPGIHSISRNMKVRFNGNRMSMPLPVSKESISNLLHTKQFDILHVQMPYSPFMAHQVMLSSPDSTAVIATFHIAPHSGLVKYATRGLALWTSKSVQRIDKAFSVSSAAADFARQTYKIKTDILPNVVEIVKFAETVPFDNPSKKFTILFLGRLVPRKGCQLLLQSLVLLKIKNPDISFRVIICGRGPLEAQLKAYVLSHDLIDEVTFAGFVTETDKARYLKTADLAVFPSSGGESFGIVLIEAMAAGNPVVLGADNPGYASVLAPYPDLLFKAGDAEGLSGKLQVYMTSDDVRSKASDWQREYVPRFDVAVVGSQLLEVYAEVRSGRPGSAGVSS